MGQTLTQSTTATYATAGTAAGSSRAGYEAYRILKLGFTVAPIVAGLDKFFYLMTNWSQYMSPLALGVVGDNGRVFMMVVGVIEIAAGIGVALRPRLFAYVVSAWLTLIMLNLLMLPGFYDVALRDLGLALGALALARLSQEYSQK